MSWIVYLNWITILWKKLLLLPLNGKKNIWYKYKHMWPKLIQERITTLQLIKYIFVTIVFLLEETKWEWYVLLYLKDIMYWWEKKGSPRVKTHPTYIIWIYWELLHSFITCTLSINYITWHITKIQGFFIKFISYMEQWINWTIIIHSWKIYKTMQLNICKMITKLMISSFVNKPCNEQYKHMIIINTNDS